MLSNGGGGADLVGSPTYLRGSSPRNYFQVYALKSVLVHPEILSVIRIILRMDPYY